MQLRCKRCVNSINNPNRFFDEYGICNVCNDYKNKFNMNILKSEMDMLKNLIHDDGSIDCLAAVSGGKDSTAMLKNICDLGFHPLAFTFDVGYNSIGIVQKTSIERAISILDIPHQYIDGRKYFNDSDKESFRLTANLYDNLITDMDANVILKMFEEERLYNSPKNHEVLPFIRPCRLCRRAVIRGYYEEAILHGVSIVFLGINEWCGINNNNYSAIRKIVLAPNREVYIVHLPFLLQKKYKSLSKELEFLGWTNNNKISIETGGAGCLLARIAEEKVTVKLGFNPDETRLAREVTCGFITRQQAITALNKITPKCSLKMYDILFKSGII